LLFDPWQSHIICTPCQLLDMAADDQHDGRAGASLRPASCCSYITALTLAHTPPQAMLDHPEQGIPVSSFLVFLILVVFLTLLLSPTLGLTVLLRRSVLLIMLLDYRTRKKTRRVRPRRLPCV
jgi:hypothetical protein